MFFEIASALGVGLFGMEVCTISYYLSDAKSATGRLEPIIVV